MQSLIRRFSSSVKDFLMPSWLSGGVSDAKEASPACSNEVIVLPKNDDHDTKNLMYYNR